MCLRCEIVDCSGNEHEASQRDQGSTAGEPEVFVRIFALYGGLSTLLYAFKRRTMRFHRSTAGSTCKARQLQEGINHSFWKP